jgi:hypothetical protein
VFSRKNLERPQADDKIKSAHFKSVDLRVAECMHHSAHDLLNHHTAAF